METDRIVQKIEAIKDRLDAEAGGNLERYLDRMDVWLAEHPHAGPVVTSPAELRTRVRHREASESPATAAEPYRVSDPIVAEVHQIREEQAEYKSLPRRRRRKA